MNMTATQVVIGTHSTRPSDAAMMAMSDSTISSLFTEIAIGW